MEEDIKSRTNRSSNVVKLDIENNYIKANISIQMASYNHPKK